jgi:polar amino acid transport system substrate-binding protein
MNNDTSSLEEGTIMKGNTFLLALLVVSLLVLCSSSNGIAGTLQDVKNRGKLIAGVKTDFPPFGFLDQKGGHRGFDIDLVKSISKELLGNEETVEFIPVTTGNRISFLTSKKVDMIAATMSITEERMKEVDFSTPYFMSGQMILVRGDNKITTYQDLAGKRVATIRGSIGDGAIGQVISKVERVRFEHNFEALQALKERQVEGFVQDYVLLSNLLQDSPGLKIAGLKPFRPTAYSLGVRKGDKEWLDFINSTLAMIGQSGESEKLLDKWFGDEAKALLRSFKK